MKLRSWGRKHLSLACKEVLLKTIAQSLPNYAMSVLLLTKLVCKEIESMMAKFLWGKSEDAGIVWHSWKRMSNPKTHRGLVFRSI